MKLKKKDATHRNEIQIIMRDSFLLFSFIKAEVKTKKKKKNRPFEYSTKSPEKNESKRGIYMLWNIHPYWIANTEMIKYFLIAPNKYGSPMETKEDKDKQEIK